MSLFKMKALATKVFAGEEFDERHLAIDFIDRQPAIALGNFQGTLRLFLISKNKEISLHSIYENKFDSGIIAVDFVSHPDESIRHSTLGVLFFKKFAFISFEAMKGQYQARIMNVSVQPGFGICVSPLSVMTLNSTVQSINPRQIYKIKVADPIYPFASQLSKLYFMDGQQLVEIEGANEQWRIILGRVRQLFVMEGVVVVIGERALWEVHHAKILKTKVMEEQISCGAVSFRSNSFNILVANFNSQVMIYSPNYELLWAMKLDYVPIKIAICQHSDIRGMLVMLSDEGSLELGYSGVEVSEGVVEPVAEEVDMSVVEAQTEEYLSRLDSKGGKEQVRREQRVSMKQGYKLSFTPIEKSYAGHQQKQKLFQFEGKLIKCQLICQVTSFQNLRNFRIQLNLPYNLYCKQQIKELKIAKNKDKIIFNLFASCQTFPYERQIIVMIRYENNEQKGAPFVKSETIPIPMALQSFVVGFETKDNFENKIIIKSSTELPTFNDLFPQLIPPGSQQQRKSVKFSLANGVECSIAYNKGFNKAKVESQYYSGLCYIISEFSSRIRKRGGIQLSVEIPLQQFFGIMKQHFEQRKIWKEAFAEVEVKSEEFRKTQKKLLVKMKEKMTNMGSIDKLLDFTFHRLMESATRYQQVTHKMDIISHNLCVAVTLILQLLFIRSNPSPKAKQMANGILGYEKETMDRGWQDKVYANSTYFLNKKYNKGDHFTLEQLQKIPLYVISKVNNGDWN